MQRFTDYQAAFSGLVERFNLLSLLGKLQLFPVGISSLLSQTMPVETPLGSQNVVQITSTPGLIALGFLLTLVGWVAGWMYFRSVSGIALGQASRTMMISFSWAILQTLLLSLIWVIGLMAVMIPMMVILTILDLAQPGTGERCFVGRLVLFFLADCAVVFYPAWDLCAQTECILFDLHQLEDGALHTPHKWIIRAVCVPALDGFELSLECPHG
jgi:hypothetical protein